MERWSDGVMEWWRLGSSAKRHKARWGQNPTFVSFVIFCELVLSA
jgi:hypothetical protein